MVVQPWPHTPLGRRTVAAIGWSLRLSGNATRLASAQRCQLVSARAALSSLRQRHVLPASACMCVCVRVQWERSLSLCALYQWAHSCCCCFYFVLLSKQIKYGTKREASYYYYYFYFSVMFFFFSLFSSSTSDDIAAIKSYHRNVAIALRSGRATSLPSSPLAASSLWSPN